MASRPSINKMFRHNLELRNYLEFGTPCTSSIALQEVPCIFFYMKELSCILMWRLKWIKSCNNSSYFWISLLYFFNLPQTIGFYTFISIQLGIYLTDFKINLANKTQFSNMRELLSWRRSILVIIIFLILHIFSSWFQIRENMVQRLIYYY